LNCGYVVAITVLDNQKGDAMGDVLERFNSRGIGQELNLPCFVSGRAVDDATSLKDNIAAFVTSKEAGERIVQMFDGLARLDYRPHEPKWIQVKVGVGPQHLAALRALQRLSFENGGVISREIIRQAKAASAALS
jgi:hypothetical protein